MNPSTPIPPVPNNASGFDSLGCLTFISDGPGDNTIRPARPEVLKWLIAEREKYAKLGLNLDGTPIKPPEPPKAD